MLIRNILFLFFAGPLLLQAQKLPLMIEGSSPDFHLKHTVGPKENYYSIGRLYNVSPSLNIAPFNNLKLADGLKIGQVIMIPLVESNFSQDANKDDDESLVPVFYVTAVKKPLYQIGQLFNNVSSASLKKWNKLSGDQAPEGSKLIIGYLKVKTDLSALASSRVNVTADPVRKAEEKDVSPVVKQDAKTNAPVNDLSKSRSEIKKEEPASGKNFSGGYFRTQYERQRGDMSGTTQTGTAGVFKSTSGWEDGKYYCLNNKAEAGSVIRITNTDNQKTIYAKVLDAMPDMKQNEGLILRLSNAAASELGVTGGTFECTIQF